MRNSAFNAVLVLVTIGGAAAANAQDTTIPVSLPALYVGDFKSVEQSGSGVGPLHALNVGIHRMKSDRNASKLSAALVEAFRKRKLQAERLPPEVSQQPQSGWLIQGVFYALDENARLVSVPLLTSQNGPNVEVTVTIADCARDRNVPFAVIGTEAALKGQGIAVGWNPYVAAATFVVHKVRGRDSMAILADQIAQKVIEHGTQLVAHDRQPR
jgi:hypothetical protein